MKRLLVGLLLLFALPAGAQQLLESLTVDLDGDGRTETVGLRSYDEKGVRYGQLVVLGFDGPPLWKAPKEDPFLFVGDYKLDQLQAVGDFDGDGKVELLAKYYDKTGPTKFRLFRWDGHKLVHLKSGFLTEAPQKPATFTWSDDAKATRFIQQLSNFRSGRLKAAIAASPKSEEHWVRFNVRAGELTITE